MPDATLTDYFYGDEAEQFIFFRIPRQLITNPKFKHISTDAKLLYGMLLDRMSLSAKNGWYDDDGRVYIYPIPQKAQEEEPPKKANPRVRQEKSSPERGTGSTPSPKMAEGTEQKPSVRKRLEGLRAASEQTRTPEQIKGPKVKTK